MGGLCALMSAGCGQGGANSGPGGPGDAGPGPDDGFSAQQLSLSVTYSSIPVGEEHIYCQVLDLGNEQPAMIRSIHTSLDPGTHHMIVEKTSNPRTTAPYDCGNTIPGGPNTLFIAQEPDSTVTYPDGTGLPINAHQHIYIELHYINYFTSPIDVTGTVDFDLAPVDPSIKPVTVLFNGPLSLDIPARSTDVTVDALEHVPDGAHIFALTTHMHHLGVDATIKEATAIGDPNATLLHESMNWEVPPLTTFDPPLVLGSGEALWLTCHYDNPGDTDVHFGISFYDEMCFLWAYYY